MNLREIGWGIQSGFIWLRIGTGGGLLWTQWWTLGFWRHRVASLLYDLLVYVISTCIFRLH
jgi:hypothetical protein